MVSWTLPLSARAACVKPAPSSKVKATNAARNPDDNFIGCFSVGRAWPDSVSRDDTSVRAREPRPRGLPARRAFTANGCRSVTKYRQRDAVLARRQATLDFDFLFNKLPSRRFLQLGRRIMMLVSLSARSAALLAGLALIVRARPRPGHIGRTLRLHRRCLPLLRLRHPQRVEDRGLPDQEHEPVVEGLSGGVSSRLPRARPG